MRSTNLFFSYWYSIDDALSVIEGCRLFYVALGAPKIRRSYKILPTANFTKATFHLLCINCKVLMATPWCSNFWVGYCMTYSSKNISSRISEKFFGSRGYLYLHFLTRHIYKPLEGVTQRIFPWIFYCRAFSLSALTLRKWNMHSNILFEDRLDWKVFLNS